jgi:hypothetical protein
MEEKKEEQKFSFLRFFNMLKGVYKPSEEQDQRYLEEKADK